MGFVAHSRYNPPVDNTFPHLTEQADMSTDRQIQTDEVILSEDDVAFLLSLLRDPSNTQPLTTQQLIEALRLRAVE